MARSYDSIEAKLKRLQQGPFFDKHHQEALQQGLDYYTDAKTGYLVWTELYHLRRGTCCNNICRHCPYKDEEQ